MDYPKTYTFEYIADNEEEELKMTDMMDFMNKLYINRKEIDLSMESVDTFITKLKCHFNYLKYRKSLECKNNDN